MERKRDIEVVVKRRTGKEMTDIYSLKRRLGKEMIHIDGCKEKTIGKYMRCRERYM